MITIENESEIEVIPVFRKVLKEGIVDYIAETAADLV